MKKIFGYELILDLKDCDLKTISSTKKLGEYAKNLCKLIKMKPYGKPVIKYFGENKKFTKGYTLVQLIETSSITGHFSEHWRAAYINIFSCKKFDASLAEEFTAGFFMAGDWRSRFLERGG
jgi:S-adenosylmethionine/arginine decarboxylase-like enzyme